MLEELVHRVEARLFAWWEPDDRPDEITSLRDEIARVENAATATEDRRSAVDARLRVNEEAAALLPTLVESSLRRGKTAQALRQALELDRVRRELDADRRERATFDGILWNLAIRLRLLRRELKRLRADRGVTRRADSGQ